jgi:hypothetical protein
MIKSVLLFALVLTAFGAFSQSYPKDKKEFVKTFQSLTSEYLSKEQKDFIKDELQVSLVELNTFPDSYFQQMVATCNLMESKKLKPYPEIYNYVFSVYSFIKNKQPEASYTAWHSSIDKLLDARNIKKFADFIELSAGFFSKNMIAESSNTEWYFYGTYAFEFTDKPFMRLTNGRLVCGFPNKDRRDKDDPRFLDSIVVYNTGGVYDPILKKWEGKGGKVTWEKVNLPANETFAELKNLEINMKTSGFGADSVLLTSPYFPGKKVLGKLNERASRITREVDKIFPEFISYEKKLTIKNLREEMDYAGGFSLQGASLIGLGSPKDPATITIYRNAKPFIVAQSQLFNIAPTKIHAYSASVNMRVGEKDSVFHPGLDFTFFKDSNMVEMARGKTGVSMAPFADSYHQLDWYVPKVTWNRTSQELMLTYGIEVGQEQRISRFESRNFYDGRLYDRLQGLEQVHPLAAIWNYCYKYDEYVIDEGKAATALGKTIDQSKSLLLELAGYGFLSYDTESKIIRVNPKMQTFINARSGKIDYDNLMFVSDMRPKRLEGYTEEQLKNEPKLQELEKLYKKQSEERRLMRNFGVLSLASLEIKLNAVDQVVISDAQSTFVLPDQAKVTIKQNRDFEFSGWANAGKLQTQTVIANYNYKANKINLIETKKTTLKVRPLREDDGQKPIFMTSSINGVVGEILVDDPNNRSGNNKAIHKFPVLKSTKPTKVYYNDRAIYKGAYDSTRFYFTCDPFELDSLDNFKEKHLRLKGELTSAGIFPSFRDSLKIMGDYSFGFSTKSPTGGYTFYGTKAKYDNSIVLSNNGLQGSGKIDFVQSTSISKLFTFLPDSTVGYAEFTNKPMEIGVQFPDVSCPEAYITYVPKKNVLKAMSTPKNELVFFKGEAKLKGMAIVQPNGMTGNGIMNFQKANLGSDNFRFKRWDIDADTSIFNLKNTFQEEGEDPLAFKTDNVTSHVSFKDRKGEFKSNNGESTITFPVNQYVCKMDIFTWLMDRDEVELSSKEKADDITINSDLDLVGPNFFSIHPKQDSLQFRAPKANFSMREKTIYCSKTEFIDVADARIYPDSMKVVIRKKAQMDPLKNSKIVANYITKYHTFVSATTEIEARRKFKAVGMYPYYDADSTKSLITMDEIAVDSSYQTFAKGSIKSDANFKLSKQFDYYGKIDIKAANPLIYFSGATRINHNCEKFAKSWMSFTAEIDPKNIQIPVSESMKSLDGQALAAGIVWRDSRTKDSIRLYPAFLSALEDGNDPKLITASGLLQYDFAANEFQIAPKDKLINRNAAGNFLALHTETCSLNGDGVLTLGMDYGDITVDAVGTVNYDQASGETTLNTTMRFNLPMDKGPWEGVAERIVAYEGSKPLEFNTTTIEQALLNWSDQKTADKLKEEYTLSETKKIKRVPDAFEKSIVITGIRLKSIPASKDQKGLMSNVEGAAIVNFFGKPVMRQVVCRAFFEQIYSQNGDHFAINIQVPGGPDYMLDYSMVKKDGVLNIITSDSELSAPISALKEDKRKTKNFLYQIATNSVFLAKLNGVFN